MQTSCKGDVVGDQNGVSYNSNSAIPVQQLTIGLYVASLVDHMGRPIIPGLTLAHFPWTHSHYCHLFILATGAASPPPSDSGHHHHPPLTD